MGADDPKAGPEAESASSTTRRGGETAVDGWCSASRSGDPCCCCCIMRTDKFESGLPLCSCTVRFGDCRCVVDAAAVAAAPDAPEEDVVVPMTTAREKPVCGTRRARPCTLTTVGGVEGFKDVVLVSDRYDEVVEMMFRARSVLMVVCYAVQCSAMIII